MKKRKQKENKKAEVKVSESFRLQWQENPTGEEFMERLLTVGGCFREKDVNVNFEFALLHGVL